ncbi:MAG: M50 family metallopeptidase [Bacteroidales bacterium]|jgi:hypothetical protein|nr:M50 family metallopeptidase [Bacteroidales bacterium]
MPNNIYTIIIIALVILIIRTRKLGIVFRSINTLIHEFSHAIIAILTGGSVLNIKLNENASGECVSKSKTKTKQFFVSLAGYPLSALFSYFLFYSIGKGWQEYIFYFFIVISIVTLIFWIRNTYGTIWILCFLVLNLCIVFIPSFINIIGNYVLILFGVIIAIDNLLGCFTLLYISITNHKKAGDATNLRKLTHIPAFFWALFFTLFSLYLIYLSYFILF